MNFNDTSPENITKITTVWSKSLNLVNQKTRHSDSDVLKNRRTQAHTILKDLNIWQFVWDNNWSNDVENESRKNIASWDRDDLIVPFAQRILLKTDQQHPERPLMKPIQMDVLMRGLLNGYRATRSVKALELFLRTDKECGTDYFVNSRFTALMDLGQTLLANELISKNISTENQWELIVNLFHNSAKWKNVIKHAKKMKKMGWDLNNMPGKNNIVGHILRTNRVFYANEEECQDLIKIGVRPTNLQVPCSTKFMEVFAQFENASISDKIKDVSKTKTTRTKKM